MKDDREWSDEASCHGKMTLQIDFVCFWSENTVVIMDTGHIQAEAKELKPPGQIKLKKYSHCIRSNGNRVRFLYRENFACGILLLFRQ